MTHPTKANLEGVGTVPPPRTMRVRVAVAYSGLSRSFIYEQLKSGRLAGVKLGRSTLIVRESLDRLLEALPPYPRR